MQEGCPAREGTIMPTLLIIDDDRLLLTSLSSIFDHLGFTVRTASSAAEGLEKLSQQQPDVVLLDLSLPDESGLEVFHRIYRFNAWIPVIFITGHGTTQTAIEAMKLGAYDYFVKPLEVEKLKELVRCAASIGRLMLHSVARAGWPCPTVVLGDRFEEHQAAALRRAGAADCIGLPGELGRLAFLLGLLKFRRRPTPAGPPPAEGNGEDDPDGMGELMGQVRRVAAQDTTLLLTGETGTGKTRLARLVHEMSPRHEEPFLVVDCGSLSATLIESELFGHARGAFTGADRGRQDKLAAAGCGTLLLDEVNALPLALQGKLLRAVDERVYEPVGSDKSQPVRARLIAASNVPLQREVEAGRFRADLYYRLDVVGFYLPPLRDRRSAVAPLALRFLKDFAARNRPDVSCFSKPALCALEHYHWPGNVRELRNVVERAVALSPGGVVEVGDLPEPIRNAASPEVSSPVPPARQGQRPWPRTLHQSKAEAEVRRIQEVLHKHNHKRARAARELGISRVGLYKKLQKYGL